MLQRFGNVKPCSHAAWPLFNVALLNNLLRQFFSSLAENFLTRFSFNSCFRWSWRWIEFYCGLIILYKVTVSEVVTESDSCGPVSCLEFNNLCSAFCRIKWPDIESKLFRLYNVEALLLCMQLCIHDTYLHSYENLLNSEYVRFRTLKLCHLVAEN